MAGCTACYSRDDSTSGVSTTVIIVHISCNVLVFSLLVGIGLGMTYTSSQVVLGDYFNKRFVMAAGISTSGGGLGTMVFAPFVNLLIDIHTWRGSLIIIGGILLNFVVVGALMRPPPKLKSAEYNTGGKTGLKSILKSGPFWLLTVNVFTTGLGLASVYLHVIASAVQSGASDAEAAIMMSVIGVGSIVGRLLAGFIGQLKCTRIPHLYFITCALTGCVVLFYLILKKTLIGRLVFSLSFGVIANGINALYMPITIEYVGLEQLSNAFGLQMFALGMGYLLGPPMTGNVTY